VGETCLAQFHYRRRYLTVPDVLTGWTLILRSLMPRHDALQYGRKRSDADSAGDQDGVLGVEDLAGRCTVGSIDVTLTHQVAII
jgi:hypothetical protein